MVQQQVKNNKDLERFSSLVSTIVFNFEFIVLVGWRFWDWRSGCNFWRKRNRDCCKRQKPWTHSIKHRQPTEVGLSEYHVQT